MDTGTPEVTPITFVLSDGRLITIRYAEPRTFKTVAAYIRTQPQLCSSGVQTLITLLEGIVDRTLHRIDFFPRSGAAQSRRLPRGVLR